MINVTRFRHREMDITLEVLCVLQRQAEPSLHEIAHDIEMHRGRRFDADEIAGAIQALERIGYVIVTHDDVDATRYELVPGGDAA